MAYERVNWLNEGETGEKPVNDINLNYMDEGIANLDTQITNLNKCTRNFTRTGTLGSDSMYWRILKFKRFNGLILLFTEATDKNGASGYVTSNLFRITNIAGECSIKELEATHSFGLKTITKARLVYKVPSEDAIYLEIYAPRAYSYINVSMTVLTATGINNIETWNEVGKIPDGFASKEIEL